MSTQENNDLNVLGGVGPVLSKTELLVQKYKKQITYAVSGVVLVALAIMGLRSFYFKPLQAEADTELSKCQRYFAVDSFKIALKGNGNEVLGFETVISEYPFTDAANLASAYAGICSYKLGDYNAAIDYLSDFDGDDMYFTTTVIGLIGDANVELGNVEEAISNYEKAIAKENKVLSPIYLKKAGIAYESLKNNEKAIELYTQIKDQYPTSSEAMDIEKYIARIEK